MKTIKLLFILGLCVCPCLKGAAQTVSLDSLKLIVERHIETRESYEHFWDSKFGSSYYIVDVSTREMITRGKYGIFEFGEFGDDLSRWILWYDPTGYKIYDQALDTEMLGEVLDFLERNNYSATASFYYIKGLYRSCDLAENVGEKEIK